MVLLDLSGGENTKTYLTRKGEGQQSDKIVELAATNSVCPSEVKPQKGTAEERKKVRLKKRATCK